jgi:hypothetical protein
MESPRPSSVVEKALKVDYDNENILLTNQCTLRKVIGILGIALPVLLWTFIAIDTHYYKPLYSISHYYMTRANPVFVIEVSLMGIFLLIYKGKDSADFYLSSIAGFCALCLIIFPTDNMNANDADHVCAVTKLNESELRPAVHYASAAIFLGCLAWMSLFIFTKSTKSRADRGRQKRRRNRVYRTCGVIMVLALLVIVAEFVGLIPGNTFSKYHLMFWMETVAVVSFGISWLVKGEAILKD